MNPPNTSINFLNVKPSVKFEEEKTKTTKERARTNSVDIIETTSSSEPFPSTSALEKKRRRYSESNKYLKKPEGEFKTNITSPSPSKYKQGMLEGALHHSQKSKKEKCPEPERKENIGSVHQISEEMISIHLFELLFKGEIDVDRLNPDETMNLNDLSLIYTRLITPADLFRRVADLLLSQSLSGDEIRILLDFCKKCLQNEIGHPFYSNDQTASLVKEICFYLSPTLALDLQDAYKQAVISADNKKTGEIVPIEPLKIQEEKALSEWRTTIEGDLWDKETLKLYARSIVQKTGFEFAQVSLEELLSGKLSSRTCCPAFNRFTDSMNNLSNLVAQDILKAETEKRRWNVIKFYVSVIHECMSMGDFASAFFLKMGFDLHPISRLHSTWPNKSEKINKLNEIFNPLKNFQNLKSTMDSFRGEILIRPPFLFAKYVTFIDENPDKDKSGMINQGKFCLLARSIAAPFQKMKNSFTQDKAQKTISLFNRRLETISLHLMSEEKLEELSLLREPKK